VHAMRERTDVRALVERVVSATTLEGRRLQIVGGTLTADVDGAKVERIVENLIANAVKHTPPESAIQIRLEARGNDLHLLVEDEGPGVADEFKKIVFETFDRGPQAFSTTPGAGIGLSLVARFAAVHGGSSWVEDRPGGGASFHVLLPDCVVAEPSPDEAGQPLGV